RAPNFEHVAWNPIVAQPLDNIAHALNLPRDDAESLLFHARKTLFAERAKRVRPGLDDKILTSWNALMISGLARAARLMNASAFTALAENAIESVRANAWRNDRLYASFAGRA